MVLSIANLLVALAIGLFCAGLGYANVMRQPARFQSTAVMLMDQPLALARGDSGVVVKLNLLRGKYAALVTTSEIIAPAARDAGLSLGEMRAAQRPLYPPNSLTLLPIARSDSSERAPEDRAGYGGDAVASTCRMSRRLPAFRPRSDSACESCRTPDRARRSRRFRRAPGKSPACRPPRACSSPTSGLQLRSARRQLPS